MPDMGCLPDWGGGEKRAGGRTLECREGGGTEKSSCSTLILLLARAVGGGVGDQERLAFPLGGGGLGSRGTTSSCSWLAET